MSDKKPYDTSIARMAGNIAAGIIGPVAVAQGCAPSRVTEAEREQTADLAVDLAQRIVRRLTPTQDAPQPDVPKPNPDPRCPKCGHTMVQGFTTGVHVSSTRSVAQPTGEYRCFVCAKESR